jgi:hypothetical protein
MTSLHRTLLIVLAGMLVAGVPFASAAESERQQLFNGKDLDGWEHIGPGRVYVEDGLMKTEGGMGLLWYTREKLGDCTLRLVFRTTGPDDNSGVFIRIPKPPRDPWQAVNWGYEVQILESWPESYERSEHQKTKGDDWHTTGAIYSISPATKQPQKPAGEWNTMEIVLDGDRTVVSLNGEKVNDYLEGTKVPVRAHDYEPIRGPRPREGYIGIQNHHKPQTVHYKEISVVRH